MLRVLPTGFGKSLVFHLLSDVFDFVECEGPPVNGKAITVVIAPLNALFFWPLQTFECFPCICINQVWVTRKITTRGNTCNQPFQVKFFSIKREYLRKHCLMPKALITHPEQWQKTILKAKIAKKYYTRTAKPFAYRITLQICKIHTYIHTLLAFPRGLFNTKQHEHIIIIKL